MQHFVEQRYNTNRGLDLKASDISRENVFATSINNAQYKKNGSIEKRKGYGIKGDTAGGFGLVSYNRIDPDTDLPAPQTLAIGNELFRYLDVTVGVSYSGAALVVIFDLFFDPVTNVYRAQILEDSTVVLDYSLGLGVDESTPITCANLATQINALPGFTCTVTGTSTVPAAYLDLVFQANLKDASVSMTACYKSQVYCPISNPFAGSESRKNNEDFELVSTTQIFNNIYFSNGFDEVMKYDGQTLYRAGLPTPASVTSSLGGAGSVTGTNYFHKIQYIQEDAAGQIHEGNITTTATGLNPTSQQMSVVIPNIQASTGFNTNCAMANGAQTSVTTINVDNGSGGAHTLQVGDKAYFFDGVSSSYVTRTVTARTPSTITISGAAVTVADNIPISNNLKIAVYRNKTSAITPSTYFEVVVLPNNSFVATQTFTDNRVDSSLGAILIEPLSDRSPPPKGKYISNFQNLVIIAGNPTFQNKIYWSDIDGPEYFDPEAQDDVETNDGDVIRGIGPNGPVFAVLKNRSTHVVGGTLADRNYRIELRSQEIGCESHSSIIDMNGTLAWWSYKGPYSMVSGQIPEALGKTADGAGRLEPVMDQENIATTARWQRRKIVGFNWKTAQKALWLLPTEGVEASQRYTNESHAVFVYDYTRDAWLQWSNFDFTCGIFEYDNEIFFQGRRYSDFYASLAFEINKVHNTGTYLDYQDKDQPILMSYGTPWESLGDPSQLKRFLELRVVSLEDVLNADHTLTVQQEINFQSGENVAEFTMSLSSGGWGVAEYGTLNYGNPSEASARHDLRRDRIRSTRFILKNEQDQQNVSITGWEMLMDASYRTEFKR